MSALSEGEIPNAEDLVAQLRDLKVGQLLLSTAATLASLAYGKLEADDLADARLAIDSIGALLPLLAGQVDDEARRGLEQALSNLKLAYADAASASSSGGSE